MTLDHGPTGHGAENINNEPLTCLMIIYITHAENKTNVRPSPIKVLSQIISRHLIQRADWKAIFV